MGSFNKKDKEELEDDNLSFARHYRPATLDNYIGNEKIKETVLNMLSKGNYQQSMLLMGNTGCGKTTLARILTSWYMCENPNEDGSPCGECITCGYMKDYIRTGNEEFLPDIHEIDVTEQSGKADMTRILEEIEYPSYGGGWKVYILDECHEMSSGAANRLLKVVEEPPEKVLIIFCTTDPQKMLETLKNRCQLKFKVVKPKLRELAKLLTGICLQEGVEYDSEGLRMLCSRADFVIRDTLNYLEQVIKSRGNALSDSVSAEFLEVSDKIIFDFYDAYINRNDFNYIHTIYKIKTTYDFKMFMQSLVNFTIRGIYVMNSIPVEGLSEIEIESYLDVFSHFSFEELSYLLEKLLNIVKSGSDIEASLIAFMYMGNSSIDNLDISVPDTPNEQVVFNGRRAKKNSESLNSGEGKSLSSVKKEREMRDLNILGLEKAKKKESIDSLGGSFKETSFDEMAGLFDLELVNKQE